MTEPAALHHLWNKGDDVTTQSGPGRLDLPDKHRDFANVSLEWLDGLYTVAQEMSARIALLELERRPGPKPPLMQVYQVLLRAKCILIPEQFETFRVAVDRDGNRCDASSDDAVRFSLIGAISRAAEGDPRLINAALDIIAATNEAIVGHTKVSFSAFDAAHVSLGRAMLHIHETADAA